MNEQSNPGKDLQTIRDIMEKSSKFSSLSGLAGIFAGICAIIGASVALFMIFPAAGTSYREFIMDPFDSFHDVKIYLVLDAIIVLICAFSGAIFFSHRRAIKAGMPFWTGTTRRLLIHLLIPLVTGGLFILMLIVKENYRLIVPSMLVFYGLALVNAGKFTLSEIQYLGLTVIVLGIISGFFPGFGLILWTIGFGLMHIIFGTVMYLRHER